MELPEQRSRIGWWLLAIALTAALVFVAYAFVGTLVLGLFVYYGSRPIYRRVAEYVESKTLAAAGTLFLLSLPALALVGYTVAVGVRELSAFSGAAVGTYYSHLIPGATSRSNLARSSTATAHVRFSYGLAGVHQRHQIARHRLPWPTHVVSVHLLCLLRASGWEPIGELVSWRDGRGERRRGVLLGGR